MKYLGKWIFGKKVFTKSCKLFVRLCKHLLVGRGFNPAVLIEVWRRHRGTAPKTKDNFVRRTKGGKGHSLRAVGDVGPYKYETIL